MHKSENKNNKVKITKKEFAEKANKNPDDFEFENRTTYENIVKPKEK